MGFIKTSMMGFLILSIISIGLYGFLGELNSNYNSNLSYNDQSTYNSEIENMSIQMKEKLNIADISTGDNYVTTNWKILSNVFSVILSVPSLFTTSIVSSLSLLGLDGTSWITIILITIVGTLFAFAFIKYVLGKDLWGVLKNEHNRIWK